MPKIIVLGAGIGGIPMAYELRAVLGRGADITVLSDTEWFHFVPSNPWVALKWRQPEDIKIYLPEVLKKFDIAFDATGAKHVLPEQNAIELRDGRRLSYDYRDRDRPGPSVRQVEAGPQANSVSICHIRSCRPGSRAAEGFCQDPGPMVVGAVQGASCFGPAYEFALLANADLRKRSIRDRVPITFVHVRALYRPSRPGWRRRHERTARVDVARPRHQVGD